jgi:carbamoyltransferase
MDSLGFFFTIMSSSKGGWTPLSSEGRYMGAAAWGDLDRLTNPYYKRLREIFHFCADGQVFINRKMANWQNTGELKPFKKPLIDLVGPPIPQKFLWNPDHVLQVEDIQHSEVTKERVDLAAATQLIFEDAVFHIVENLIRISGSDKLLLAGGSALNCLANMKLLERFDNHWYRRNLNKDTCLQLWVPPFPGDAGVPPGAAMNFALQAGGRPGRPMKHAFYCGHPPEIGDIDSAIEEDHEISKINFGNVNDAKQLVSLADLMAYILSKDGVVGIFQGSAETGPRALGHRSILANPCNPLSLQTINKLVKYREPIRPLAPMATIKAASELFELQLGAEADDFNVYHYMIMTVRARPVAYEKIPAVVHKDGTVRLQLVNQRSDPVCYAFLQSMGRRLGVEASVNTSLNIGGPIVQTPIQALQVLKKAKALTILVMIGAEGSIRLAWHNVNIPPKDGGVQFKNWLEDWSTQQHKNLIIA